MANEAQAGPTPAEIVAPQRGPDTTVPNLDSASAQEARSLGNDLARENPPRKGLIRLQSLGRKVSSMLGRSTSSQPRGGDMQAVQAVDASQPLAGPDPSEEAGVDTTGVASGSDTVRAEPGATDTNAIEDQEQAAIDHAESLPEKGFKEISALVGEEVKATDTADELMQKLQEKGWQDNEDTREYINKAIQYAVEKTTTPQQPDAAGSAESAQATDQVANENADQEAASTETQTEAAKALAEMQRVLTENPEMAQKLLEFMKNQGEQDPQKKKEWNALLVALAALASVALLGANGITTAVVSSKR